MDTLRKVGHARGLGHEERVVDGLIILGCKVITPVVVIEDVIVSIQLLVNLLIRWRLVADHLRTVLPLHGLGRLPALFVILGSNIT